MLKIIDRYLFLLSVVSKIAERCVNNHVYPILYKKLTAVQHGFQSGKQTCPQLVLFADNLMKSLEEGRQSDVTYVDFKKVFDSVNHEMLITN